MQRGLQVVTNKAFFFVHYVMEPIPGRGCVNTREMKEVMTARDVVETVPTAFTIVLPPGRCEVSHCSGGS